MNGPSRYRNHHSCLGFWLVCGFFFSLNIVRLLLLHRLEVIAPVDWALNASNNELSSPFVHPSLSSASMTLQLTIRLESGRLGIASLVSRQSSSSSSSSPLVPAGAQAASKCSSSNPILGQPLNLSPGIKRTLFFQSPDRCARCFLGGLAFSFPVGSRSGLDVRCRS